MKVMGQGMLVGTGAGRASAAELLQFNLSQPVAGVIIGCEQTAALEQNVQAAQSFTPIDDVAKRSCKNDSRRPVWKDMKIRQWFEQRQRAR